MKIAAAAIVLLIALALGWFFVSPLFIDKTVDEPLEFMTADGRVDVTAILSLPADDRAAMKREIMEAAAAAPDSESAEPMPADAPAVLASGRFVDADAVHKGSGTATIYALPDGRHVVRFEDFRTTNGPKLVVYLARHPAPRSAADVVDPGYVELGALKGNVGNQNYEIPRDADIADYGSVVIWCELFGVLFSPASLEPS